MKLGIASGVYLNYPFAEAIARVAAAGYDTIDAWSGRPHIYRHDFSEEELRRLRRLAEEHGLAISSFLPAFYRYPYNLSSPNDIIREDSIAYLQECVDNAALLGAPIVLLVPGRTLYGQSFEDGWYRLAESVDRICRYARQYDLKLGLEAVNHFVSDLVNTAASARDMAEQLGHDNLGVVLDTGHMNLADETTERALNLLGDTLLQVHVNDNDGLHQQGLVPGEGSFDFEELHQRLRASGFDGCLTAELGYHYTLDPDSPVRETATRMRRLLERGGA